jgi:hypothetical protein
MPDCPRCGTVSSRGSTEKCDDLYTFAMRFECCGHPVFVWVWVVAWDLWVVGIVDTIGRESGVVRGSAVVGVVGGVGVVGVVGGVGGVGVVVGGVGGIGGIGAFSAVGN